MSRNSKDGMITVYNIRALFLGLFTRDGPFFGLSCMAFLLGKCLGIFYIRYEKFA